MNVVLVPGLMGSQLLADQWVVVAPIWLDYFRLAGDGLPLLRLDDAGTGPAPLLPLRRWLTGPPLPEYYGLLIGALRGLGHDVLAWGYDWRLSIPPQGERLYQAATRKFGTAPIWFVGHSMGGLVARAAWAAFAAHARADQCQRLVTLGTPHYGSLSTVRVWGRLDYTYLTLASLVSALRLIPFVSGVLVVDPVIASWPSLYELMPWRDFGPLAGTPSIGRDLYMAATYRPWQPWVRQDRLDAAILAQASLAGAGDPSRTVTVQGSGLTTASQVLLSSRLAWSDGYGYSPLGDGQVPYAYSAWAGATRVVVPGAAHHELPYWPAVLAALPRLLDGSVVDGEQLG